MDLGQAEALALELMGQHGLLKPQGLFMNPWNFGWNGSKRNCGVCIHAPQRIELSRYYVSYNSEELVRNTILHEIAHAKAGYSAGHGRKWQLMAISVGARPEACNTQAVQIPGKYQAVCPGCGHVYHMHRRPTRGWYGCGICKRKTGSSVEISFQGVR